MASPPTISHRARVDAALRGQILDRPPASLWRHFYESEGTAVDLANATLAWQRRYDWDWMKINPRASFQVEGWGVRMKVSGLPTVKPVVLDVPVKTVRDWGSIKPLSMSHPVMAEQLEVVQRIRAELGPDLYVLVTIFSPLSVAGDLVVDDTALLEHMRQDPQAIHAALEAITTTFRDFATEALAVGASGIFLATTTWASYDTVTDDVHAEYGRPYELAILDAAQRAPLNVLHVCQNNNMLLKLADYPVHALNWAVGSPGNPSLAEARRATDRCLVGGLRAETLQHGTPEAVEAEVRAAAQATDTRRWMLGPACSIPVTTPHANVAAARAAIEAVAR